MKLISRLSVLTLSATILAVSCGDFVSNIQVKGTPTFYAPLGTAKLEISKYLSIEKIREMMGADSDDATLQVYEYPFERALEGAETSLAQDNTMRFLVRYPLTSIDLDFGQYLDSFDIDTSIGSSMPAQTFKVPAIERPTAQRVDFNGAVLDALNATPALNTFTTVPAGGTATSEIPVTLSGFDTASFHSGSLVLRFGSVPANLTLTSVSVRNGATEKIPYPGPSLALTNGSEIPLSLAGVSNLDNEINLVLGLSASAAVSGNMSIEMRFSPATRLSGASGVVLSPSTVSLPGSSIPAISDTSFVRAVVGAGSIDLAVAPESGTVTGLNKTLNMTVSQSGGLDSGLVNSTSDTPSIDLAGETINADPISISGTMLVSSANAVFTGLGPDGLIFTIGTTVEVTNYSSVTMKPGAGFNFVTEISEPVSQDMVEWVKSVNFNKVGLELDFRNGLPAGNAVSIRVQSTAFAIDRTETIAPNSGEDVREYINSAYLYVPATHPVIDYTITLTPPGYNPVDATMTLNNLSPGQIFTLSLASADKVSDWTQIIIDPQDGFAGTFPGAGDDPLDMSSLTELLGEGLGFAEIPMYFYLSGIDGLDGTADINATYLAGGTVPSSKSLTGADSTIVSVPALSITSTEGLVSAPLSVPSSKLIGFADIVNSSPTNLSIGYTIDIDELPLAYGDLYDAEGNAKSANKLTAELVILFPIKFEVASGGAVLNIPGLNKEDGEPAEDLFGRKPATGSEENDINRALKNLDSMVLTVKYNNRLGLNGTFSFTAPLSDGTIFSKPLTLLPDEGSTELTISRTDIQDIIDTIPFAPSFEIRVEEDLAFPRNAGLDATITVKVVTDINETFSLGGEN